MDAELDQIKRALKKRSPKRRLPPDAQLWRDAISLGFAEMRGDLKIQQAATKPATGADRTADRVAQRIRTMRENGKSYQIIADHLNSKNIPTPSGDGEWHPTSVRRLASS